MGDEHRCTVRYGEQVAEGKALLETDELVFRGDFRLKIPLREIRSIETRDGSLTVGWRDERASFQLGPRAERWAERIREPRTLLDKLGVKPGQQISLVDVRDDKVRELLHTRGVEFADGPRAESDVILFGVESIGALERLTELQTSMKRDGAIWVIAPKGGREPREATVLEAGKRSGLVDVKVVRFSETHTGHKFVLPRNRR
ncbi:MAG: DUF3052 domain-containing protein [Actinomycetota bacterium]|nr:DUF3052 domain-containing protein [Actinomycetota bacterium]